MEWAGDREATGFYGDRREVWLKDDDFENVKDFLPLTDK